MTPKTGRLHLRRESEDFEIPLLENEYVLHSGSAAEKNVIFVLIGNHGGGNSRLLKLELPLKNEALNTVKVEEFLNSGNRRIPFTELFDVARHGTTDDKTLEELKNTALPAFTIESIHAVSPDGDYLLLSRGDLELLKINPITFRHNRQPYLYDVTKNSFAKTFP